MKTNPSALVYIRVGGFSGSALSLREALRARVPLVDCSLLTLARNPILLPARLMALREARRSGLPSLWAKTAAWSRATQRILTRRGLLLPTRPILFVQTLPAFELPSSLSYAIYADRAAREGIAAEGPERARFTPEWLEREATFLRRARRIYVMGPTTRDALEVHYGITPAKVQVVGAGPNMRLGPPVASHSCRRFLFVGIEWERKGGPDLLVAFAAIREEFPHLELLIVGSQPPPPLPAGVRALGRVPPERMDAIYSQADALVIPTLDEPFGIALVEGLIKGLPCIATTIGNQQWIIEHAGICVEPRNVPALTSAMRDLVEHYPTLRRAAEERGHRLREEFRWERVAHVILQDLLPHRPHVSQSS